MTYNAPSGATAPKTHISGYKTAQLPNFTPEMMNLFNKLIGGVSGGAGKGLDYYTKLAGGDEDIFKQIEAPAYEAFNRTSGDIASRFSGMGARDSSAFQNSISGAQSQMAQELASNRNKLSTDAIDKLLNLSNSLLGKSPYENVIKEKKQNTDMQDIGNLLGQILPLLLAML